MNGNGRGPGTPILQKWVNLYACCLANNKTKYNLKQPTTKQNKTKTTQQKTNCILKIIAEMYNRKGSVLLLIV